MIDESRERITASLGEDEVVLDVGGGGRPFARADLVLDIMPYEDRGLYGEPDPERERFDVDGWLVRDICDREPFPFADNEIDFSVCSHTLEDIRDPIWVCSELSRISKRGYVEVPSRLQEQSYGVHGPWVGWSHHRWLIDRVGDRLEFVGKPAVLQARQDFAFAEEFGARLSPRERIEAVFWDDRIEARERVFLDGPSLDAYLGGLIATHGGHSRAASSRGRFRWLRRRG